MSAGIECVCSHDAGHHQAYWPMVCAVDECRCSKFNPRPPPARSCRTAGGISKRQFDSKATAKRAARRVGHGLSVYRCPVCDWWHLGHAPQKRSA